MEGQQAIQYIHSFQWQKQPPGLNRIRTLLHRLGDPQQELKFVHVAGTNGKGSVCAMLASILQMAGYRVGLNTSPYLESFYERIQVNGRNISPQELAVLTEQVRWAAEAMEPHPTEFELIVAIAMLYFREQRCDIVVLETGLGGELDATNVIDVPEAAVLTAMGVDHVEQLGGTIPEIARAKAGIIKPGGRVVSCGTCAEADQVFQQVCAGRRAALTTVDHTRLRVQQADLHGTIFDFMPQEGLYLPLLGAYQTENAAVAITTVEVLQGLGWHITRRDIRRGLEKVRWPGRLELLRTHPVFLLDGAHNLPGMRAAAASLRQLAPQQKWVFLLGVLRDKDVSSMLLELLPLAKSFVAVTPDSPRALEAGRLQEQLQPLGVPVTACASMKEAVYLASLAAGTDGAVCALGTLYFSSDVRQAAAELPEQV